MLKDLSTLVIGTLKDAISQGVQMLSQSEKIDNEAIQNL